jgi:uncharacterized protein (TIGR03435 family)
MAEAATPTATGIEEWPLKLDRHDRFALRNYVWQLFLLAVWIAVSGGSTNAQSSSVPDKPAALEITPAFEVATIKPAARDSNGHVDINYPPGGRFSAINITLPALMQWAYGMPQRQILDGPSWLASTRFDIEATSDSETDKQLSSTASDQERALKRRMVQALLAERYGLKLHQETRILPAYDLFLAKGGAKLQPSQFNGRSISSGRAYFNGQGLTMILIAEQLSQLTGRIVVDKTKLPDRYDLKLEWSPDSAPITDSSAPSLFTAIQEQLGLKLEPAKEPVPVLVIDHVEQPSAN